MASSEERIKQLAEENLGRSVNLDVSAADSGVSSVDAVALFKVVGEAFNVTIPPDEAAKFSTLRDLVNYVDSHTG